MPTILLFISTWEKSYEDIYRSPPHVPVKHPNNNNKICPLPSTTCFQQHFHDWFYVLSCKSDLSKLEWTILLFNSNYIRHLTNRRKLFAIPVAEYASCSHQVRTLKTNPLGLISSFSKYYFKTGTIFLLFLPSHVLTALEYDGNHFGILLWKIVKPRDHNEIKPPIGKIFRKYKTIRHYLVMSQKQLLCLFVNKVYNNYNNLYYLQKNKKYYNLETIFRKKANFSQ